MRRTLTLLVALLCVLPCAAQNVDIEALAGLQFNFGNPGARALGMGGAFIGLADDASAAEANPAGLTILRRPEVSIEARNYLEQQVFTTSGTYPDLERTAFTNHSDRAVVTFASAVMPVKRFTFGLYFHEPLNNEGAGLVIPQQDSLTGQVTPVPNFFMPAEAGDPIGAPISPAECLQRRQQLGPFSCVEYRFTPFVSALSVRQRTLGLAGAWQIHPRFSIGASARHQRFEESALTFRFNILQDGRLFPTQILAQVTSDSQDGTIDTVEEADTTFTGGFKWSPTDWLSVGGVYKQGPSFAAPLFYADANTNWEYLRVAETKFHMPDIAGVGISVRPIPVLTINVDAVHVKYSNLIDDFVAAGADVSTLDQSFHLPDVTELRLGAEYFFATTIPIAVRAGYWRDPAHSIEWRGPLDRPEYVAEAILYPKGKDQDHFSIGVGIALPRFSIDAAYDTSDHFKVGSISMVTRF